MCPGRGPIASARHLQTARTFGRWDCINARQRERGEGVPVRSLHVPSHVPSHPQTAAKVRGFSPTASGFIAETDWLLEESGFEPLVPLATEMLIALARGISNATRMLAVGDIGSVPRLC
jgi:hypothetical protein